MPNQLTSNAEALRLFFNDDIYLVKDTIPAEASSSAAELPPNELPNVHTASNLATVIETPSIVAEPIEDMVKAPVLTFDFKFIGGNQKQVLILVNDANNEVSSAEGRELLRKLVKAIGLTGSDFALLNYAAYQEAKYQHLHAHFGCKVLLAFGVTANQLGLSSFPLHQLVVQGDVKMVFTTNLHELHSDQASKKVLWAGLQQINNA